MCNTCSGRSSQGPCVNGPVTGGSIFSRPRASGGSVRPFEEFAMNAFSCRFLFFAGVLGLLACGGRREAQSSRPVAEACTAPAPGPGTCAAPSDPTSVTYQCTGDANCTAGINGRCMATAPFAGCGCQYDACSDDASCGGSQVCICRGAADWDSGNTCLAGNCRVNADCASGYCSLSESNTIGFYCHTARDTCYNNSDCAKDPTCAGINQCEYTTEAGYWQCLCRPNPV